MAPEGDNATAIDMSDQQNLDNDHVSSTPAVTSTTTPALPPDTSNDNEQDEIKPSKVQFHPTVKKAVPLSRTDRFFRAVYAMVPSIPTSIQEGPTAINPSLHCNNLVKPGGQPRRELPENFQLYARRAGYGERTLARAMENLPSLPAGLPSLPSLLTALPSMPSMPSLSSMASMPSMPVMPSLSSLPYRRGPERRARRLSDRSYTTLLEPFEPVENPVDQTDESVGEIIPADAATGASTPSLNKGESKNANPEPLSSSEDEAYFCIYDDVETDVGYEARRHQAEAQSIQRAQYWDAARQVRNKAGTMVRAGAKMALVGAQVGAAAMATTAQDQMTDIMRDLSVRGARNRLAGSLTAGNRHIEAPIEGEDDKASPQASPGSAYLDEMGDPYRSESGESSDSDEISVEDQEGVVTEGLTVVGGAQPIASPYGQKDNDEKQKKKRKLTGQPARSTPAPGIARRNKGPSNNDEFFGAPEDATTNAANNAACNATASIANKEASNSGAAAFEDVDLSRSEFVLPATSDDNDDDEFDIITEEEAGGPRYSLDDVSPHVRRPLNNACGRSRPSITAYPRPPVRSAGFQRPPSPGTIGIAMVSERAHELPRGRRVSRGNGSRSGDQ